MSPQQNWMKKGLYAYASGILIVFLSIGIFAFINPEVEVKESCTIGSGINCLDFKLGPTGAVISVENTLDEEILVNKIELGNCENSYTELKVNAGEVMNIPVDGCDMSDKVFEDNIKITYAEGGSNANSVTGNIVGEVGNENIYKSLKDLRDSGVKNQTSSHLNNTKQNETSISKADENLTGDSGLSANTTARKTS